MVNHNSTKRALAFDGREFYHSTSSELILFSNNCLGPKIKSKVQSIGKEIQVLNVFMAIEGLDQDSLYLQDPIL